MSFPGFLRTDAAPSPTLVLVRRRDPPPQDAIVERVANEHGPWLLRWFGRRARTDDAEDLAQETLLSLVRNRDRIREPDRIAGYLLTAARRILRDHIDRRARTTTAHAEEPVAPAPSEDDRAHRLDRAMRDLPDELEQAVDAYYTREVTYEECAALLGIPRSLLQSRLRRAKEILRRKIDEPRESPVRTEMKP